MFCLRKFSTQSFSALCLCRFFCASSLRKCLCAALRERFPVQISCALSCKVLYVSLSARVPDTRLSAQCVGASISASFPTIIFVQVLSSSVRHACLNAGATPPHFAARCAKCIAGLCEGMRLSQSLKRALPATRLIATTCSQSTARPKFSRTARACTRNSVAKPCSSELRRVAHHELHRRHLQGQACLHTSQTGWRATAKRAVR